MGFFFPFDFLKNSMSPCPCLYFSISIFPWLQVLVSMSPFLQVSMSHVYVSMFLCLHVSGIPLTELMENGNFYLFAAKEKSQTSVCCYVSMSMSPCFRNSTNGTMRKTATCVCLLQTENGRLLFVCCKWKQKTEVCFPLSANDKQ